MKKFYEKSETWFAIVLIIIYSIGMSLVTDLNKAIGIEYSANIPFLVVLTAVITVFIVKNGLQKNTGFAKLHCLQANFCGIFRFCCLFHATCGLAQLKI